MNPQHGRGTTAATATTAAGPPAPPAPPAPPFPPPPIPLSFFDLDGQQHWMRSSTRPLSAEVLATQVLAFLDHIRDTQASRSRLRIGTSAERYLKEYVLLHGVRALSRRNLGPALRLCGFVIRYTQAYHRCAEADACSGHVVRYLATRSAVGDASDDDATTVDRLTQDASGFDAAANMAHSELDTLQEEIARFAKRIYADVEADARRIDPTRRRLTPNDYEALTVEVGVATPVAAVAPQASGPSDGNNSTAAAAAEVNVAVNAEVVWLEDGNDRACCCICQEPLSSHPEAYVAPSDWETGSVSRADACPDTSDASGTETDTDDDDDDDDGNGDGPPAAPSLPAIRRPRVCNHLFHDACLRRYMMGPSGVDFPVRCPMCRADTERGRLVRSASEAERMFHSAIRRADPELRHVSLRTADQVLRYDDNVDARNARQGPVRRFRVRRPRGPSTVEAATSE